MDSCSSDKNYLSQAIIHKLNDKNCKSENIRRLANYLGIKYVDYMTDNQVQECIKIQLLK